MARERDTNGAPSACPAAIAASAPCPCPRDGGRPLKALVLGACALVLCMSTVVGRADAASSLETRLTVHVESLRKDASVVRFFETHRWLLNDPAVEVKARATLSRAKRRLAVTRVKAERARRALAARKATTRLAALRAAHPRKAICAVFGPHCGEALRVAHCESRLSTNARNGHYLGLFQMGSSERSLFGHGGTAYEQARAAHRYFVRSGRDWSPWSCKPWS